MHGECQRGDYVFDRFGMPRDYNEQDAVRAGRAVPPLYPGAQYRRRETECGGEFDLAQLELFSDLADVYCDSPLELHDRQLLPEEIVHQRIDIKCNCISDFHQAFDFTLYEVNYGPVADRL